MTSTIALWHCRLVPVPIAMPSKRTEVKDVEPPNGETALERLLDEEVVLVRLRADMPGLDGLEVLSRVKQQEPNCSFFWKNHCFICFPVHPLFG